jgi:glycosyltransferase involved in cell wall biosynthesis
MRLADALGATRETVVLASDDAIAGADHPWRLLPKIARWTDTQSIRTVLAEAPADAVLLWQYVPHMYGRGGANPGLPGLWSHLRASGRRQVFIAHEIAADLTWRPAPLWYALNHRRQWRALRSAADAVGVSTEKALLRWRPAGGESAAWFLAPSPSNMPVLDRSPDERIAWRKQNDLPEDTSILIHFGSFHAHKRPDWVLRGWRAARAAGANASLVVVGSDWKPELKAHEEKFFRSLGYQAAGDVDAALHAADVAALPFFDGASERRGSLMAALARGLPVATTVGHNTGPTLSSATYIAVSPADAMGEFVQSVSALLLNPSRRRTLGERARKAYEESYSWPVLTSRLEPRLD